MRQAPSLGKEMGNHRKFPEMDAPKEEALSGPTILPCSHVMSGRLSWAA